ncbi:hypothetical protein X927_04245 [Petrotoga mexicana DSM 14811]|uniref:Uncharacterized protein n=1 Tax=Petrotoga mexicana DSM 14811 TaxID=1122954 RepID=A0A2K1PBU7_9BACT|nr:hypothetical protein [Petrotoga mexicana]PNS00269.1 hypothetical protein X927_04245 [Petrotoga mexicana DSM 14811]
MKKFVVVLLITVLVLGGIFVYEGDDDEIDRTNGLEPTEIVNVVEEVE